MLGKIKISTLYNIIVLLIIDCCGFYRFTCLEIQRCFSLEIQHKWRVEA